MKRLHPQRLGDFDIMLELLPVDRIYQRWACSVGWDMPGKEWNGEGDSPSELPIDAAIWVDRYVCKRPERMRKFLHAWYRGQDPSAKIARRFGIGRDEVYLIWRAYLSASRADFLAEPCVARLMTTNYLQAA